MHVAQIMLIQLSEGDDPRSAVDARLSDFLEGSGGTWFDWFGEGAFGAGLAGRWSGQVIETDWLRYSDNPELAEQVIDTFMEQRLANLERNQTLMEGVDVSTVSYDERGDFDMRVYAAYKACKILQDYWTEDSAIYDLDYYSPDLRDFRERVKTNPTEQYLVVVDFHF